MFRKILIANRGEIACRIARACRDCGVTSVAVYSDADRDSLHVRLADEARHIGEAPSSESYLRMDTLVATAKAAGAEAIHPGYGFLAENAEFARLCRDSGLAFIGPSPETVALMGDKAQAREVARRAGVPIVPGSEPLDSSGAALAEADRIGYPVLVKATGGGGGKGMRQVLSARELPSAFDQARSEAMSSFGDPSVYLEKLVDRPRHIELQILGDGAGNVVHLFERECSIQRRHQKLIEEAPSPFVDDELRGRMGAAAVALARESGYANAGTVEFLVDASRNFYFLEMNARLQVEHPVTELITGLDLVRLQLEIAAGGSLPFSQEEVRRRGWAMEFRVTAEDPFQNFVPSSGSLSVYRPPEGPGVRHDGGVFEGGRVTPHYDPLIAKLVVFGDDRVHAIARGRRAIAEYRISGIASTLPFFERILEDERFLRAEIDVGFVDRLWMSEIAARAGATDGERELAALGAAAACSEELESTETPRRSEASLWKWVGLRDQIGGI